MKVMRGDMGRGVRALAAVLALCAALMLGVMRIPAQAEYVDEDGVFLLGLIPEENIFRQVKKHKPLEEYLTERLGLTVRFTILSRYPDIIDRFSSRGLDGAFFGIFTSALAQESLGVVPVARPVDKNGRGTAQGCFLARKSLGIRGAADMRGRRIAYVDMATATGYLYAIAYMKEHGIADPASFFGSATFTGSHETSIYTVLSGRADVGVVKCRIFEKVSEKDPLVGEELSVIARSEDLPDNTLCLRPGIPPEFRQKLLSILLSMHKDPKGREVLEALDASRFMAASWEEFAAVKKMAGRAGADLKDYRYR